MWSTIARRGACLGAASWLFIAAKKSVAVADVNPSSGSCATATHANRLVHTNSAPEAPAHSTGTHKPPPSVLQEGTHFAVLKGADGSSSKLGAVAAAMLDADVVLLGEFHDDAVAHALQLALFKHVADKLGYKVSQQAAQQPQQQHQHQQPAEASQHEQQQQQQEATTLQQPRPLILSLEMFETDTQEVLTEYLSGLIRISDLMKDARPWSNYIHDYQPLVEVCKQLQLPVVAANAPRRYVSLAGREGSAALQQLPAAAKRWLPPLPHAAPSQAYIDKVQQQMQQVSAGMAAARQQKQQQQSQEQEAGQVEQQQQQQQQQQQAQQPQQPQQQQVVEQEAQPVQQQSDSQGCPYIGLSVSSNFLASQTLWDATMAYSIAQALHRDKQANPEPPTPPPRNASPPPATAAATATAEGRDSSNSSSSTESPGPLVVHVSGKFHIEDRLGIPEHLTTYAPGTKVLVVVFNPHDNPLSLSPAEAQAAGLVGTADFVVLTDSRLPRSFTVDHPV